MDTLTPSTAAPRTDPPPITTAEPAPPLDAEGLCACGLKTTDDGHEAGCPHVKPCSECGGVLTHGDDCSKREVVLDGTSGGPTEKRATVDGTDATVRNAPPRGEGDPERERTLKPPKITPAMLASLQEAYDLRQIHGITQPLSKGTPCKFYQIENGKEVGCTALAVFEHIDLKECPSCHKKKRTKTDPLCIAHEALNVAERLPWPQMHFAE